MRETRAMKRLGLLLMAPVLCCAQQAPRPRILGVAHMALYVSDLGKARAFYKDFLGFAELDGSDRIAVIKINDLQYLELFAENPKEDGQLHHISFYTDSAGAMRHYLAARGVKVPETVGKGQLRDSSFAVKDPDGHTLEIVEYEPASRTMREKGKFMPETRIAAHMMHVGILVGALDPAMTFYGDLLGFQEFWRGSSSGRVLSWVNMRVPDGEDYLEFMLYSNPPDARERGVRNHVCLETPDVQKAVAILETPRTRIGYERPIEVRLGTNRKRQANLFDPDGTRIELMEPHTVDGQPAPSSPAPPPR